MHDIEKTLNKKIYLNLFIIVFSKYHDFFNIFFMRKLKKKLFHRFNDYKILLIFNKKSSFNFIYDIF